MIKQFIYMIILICVPAITGWAAPTASEAGKTDVPVVSGVQSVFDAGELVQGEEIRHTFTLSNKGKTPLVIERIQSDCSCTAADYDKTILPGTTGKVTLKVDTRKFRGQISRTSVLHVSDPENPRRELTINAHILPVIETTPNRVFLNGFTNETLEQEVLIQAHKKTPLRFEVEKSGSLSGIAYTLTPLEKDRIFRLTVTNTNPKARACRGRLIFRTNYLERPVFVIPIFGRILNDIQVTPKQVRFSEKELANRPPAKPKIWLCKLLGLLYPKSAKSEFCRKVGNKDVYKDVWIRVNRGKPVKVGLADIPEDVLQSARLTEVEKGALYRLRVVPERGLELSDISEKAFLTLHTDRSAQRTIKIPFGIK